MEDKEFFSTSHNLGQAIKKRRELLGMTQTDLSVAAKVNQSSISQIENGMGNNTLKTLHSICQVLGLDVELIERELKNE